MTLGENIDRLLDEGFDLCIGPHYGRAGFYATVFRMHETRVCDECEAPDINDWDGSGHGFTPEEALANAEAVAKTGEPETYYGSDKFQ